MSRLLSSTYIKESLAAYLCQFLETFNSEHFDPRIDALADLIRPHVYTDNYKPFSNQMFEQNLSQNVVLPGGPGGGNVAGLKSFVSARFNSLKQQFAAYTWCWLATEEPQHLTDVQLWPNPGSDNFEISCTAGMNEIAVFDATGRVVYRETPGNATTATIDVRHWSPGVYLINVWSGYEVVKRKFIKVH